MQNGGNFCPMLTKFGIYLFYKNFT